MIEDMYQLTSPKWAGLAKVVEETSELNDVLAKVINTGGQFHLVPKLIEELGDVLATVEFFIHYNDLNTDDINKRKQYKLQLYEAWREYV